MTIDDDDWLIFLSSDSIFTVPCSYSYGTCCSRRRRFGKDSGMSLKIVRDDVSCAEWIVQFSGCLSGAFFFLSVSAMLPGCVVPLCCVIPILIQYTTRFWYIIFPLVGRLLIYYYSLVWNFHYSLHTTSPAAAGLVVTIPFIVSPWRSGADLRIWYWVFIAWWFLLWYYYLLRCTKTPVSRQSAVMHAPAENINQYLALDVVFG